MFGTGFVTVVPLLAGVVAATLLIWSLLRPTRVVLLFGTLYWALQIFSVQFPDALYAFRLGISIAFDVISNSSYTVGINLLAIIVTALFASAAIARPVSISDTSTPSSNT